ncbi:molybdopterin molybdotransferase MoeA [Campylobacter gastrosuis]|uniref:Molybdopterin molybdenumtransferase n=1 Tax=Campylobacter gastrosuis TaxID=2974576 RepID=A0ABT7HPC3_9BACT|nr:molybdopterin molybdotransferase MoeA [Campylobacter gastrosuis]MDL0088249.1 molybdopterin molybdotransferase MoeA [Campylobacter gastrosuis]
MASLSEANEALNAINLDFTGEFVNVKNALNRELIDDIFSTKDLPCFDNSALDGYALKFEYKQSGYVLKDTILAGDKRNLEIKDNECIRIMTGAKFPSGADTILRLEDSYEKDGLIYAKSLKKGEAHRLRGEEVKSGEILIKNGTKLTPAHLMLLASQGINEVFVKTLPKIAIFSSGNELREPWQRADDDEIYNANAHGISALLLQNGFKSSYLGTIKDSFEATKNALKSAMNFDVIICSGGASKGDADYMKDALLSLGFTEIFSHVNIRPGAPSKAFKNGNKIAFVLAGNPMAAFLMAFLLIVPFLTKTKHELTKATLKNSLKLKSGRINVVLGEFKNGVFNVLNDNKYGSGMITPLVNSNAIYLSKSDESEILEGSEIFILRLS